MRAIVATALLFAVASSAAAAPRTQVVPVFDHVFVIVFENKERRSVIGSDDAPTFNAMAKRYAQLTNYYGVAHPSLPNYLALVSGSTQGIHSDCTTCAFTARTLASILPPARTWKLYAEGLPNAGFGGSRYGRYAKKHAPFLYFRGVDRRQVVPLRQLHRDLAADALPDFALVVPDLCHSMHDCSVRTGDTWLRGQLAPLLEVPNTVVFVIFDEGPIFDIRHGGGHVPALALGTAVRKGSVFTRLTGHYGLLRTIEDAWGLPRLGRSASATAITGIWR
jgi:phosphatidylinositol-3-phosphatase